MVVFPTCKINLGLDILCKRADGYHHIFTVMYPVPWTDILEIVPTKGSETTLTVTGNAIDCPTEKNLVIKAYNAIKELCPGLPAADIYLHKEIPDQAGLGGGSADAAFTITTLNSCFKLGLSQAQMTHVAAKLGSDCPFFIYNSPMLCTGRGTEMEPVSLDLTGYYLVIAKPQGNVSTPQAYSMVTPQEPQTPLWELIQKPIDQWQGKIKNDFQIPILSKIEHGARILEELSKNAVYSSMSGSGSALFGLYSEKEAAQQAFSNLKGDSFVTHIKFLKL